MNREQKAATIAEIADQIEQSQAILAVDYRGITVTQIAELRTGLRQSDTTFRVVKNSLTERAADQSGAEQLKPLLVGPTALAFVRGDVATAAKVVADYGRSIQMLPFKGGLMDGATLDGDQLRSLSRLPPREVLYGQLVGVVASPVTGLVRSLNALLGGLAVALGQVRDKMQSGEIKAGAPDAPAEVPEAATETKEEEAAAEAAPAQDEAAAEPEASSETEAPAETEVGEDTPSAEAPAQADPAEAEEQTQGADAAGAGGQAAPGEGAPSAEASAEAEVAGAGEPAQQPDQQDDQAEASSEAATDAAAEPAKEE
jgi:large subunit ribosomal protein L10